MAVLDKQVEEALKEKAESLKDTKNETGSDGSDATEAKDAKEEDDEEDSKFPKDLEIEFGPQKDLAFARRAYRIANVPKKRYIAILSQTADGSFALVGKGSSGVEIDIFAAQDYPSDKFDATSISASTVVAFDVSTDRDYVSLIRSDGSIQVVPNKISSIMSACRDPDVGVTNADEIALSVWPALEYKQMYNDAWRMLRDYFYDVEMHQVDWQAIHERYLPLVERCRKREDLDDILAQMAAELSALHVFVYGGEYNSPFSDDSKLTDAHTPASLGATLQRNIEWKGYVVKEIALRDPDFNLLEDQSVYSPLSDQALRPSGQKGLQAGDVIVGVNGESVFRVPDIHMLLRGRAGRSVRLEVLRLSSGETKLDSSDETPTKAAPEPVLVVPIKQEAASDLRYNAWEWKTREKAKSLAKDAGFDLAYIHLRSMGQEDMDQFARSYFEDYDKQAMILDMRHNRGGNIDSWISSFLERKAWYFFQGRVKSKGVDLDWNQQFAFRGHVVVLIDEKTSSDGEGISRAISELGLGVLIGKRTWGGGIWLSSDNRLVDGGIATAPEDGVYNDKFGWGMGIEAEGIKPDIEVDNNPRSVYEGTDAQLERAIEKLKQWLEEEPVEEPSPPAKKPDKSLQNENCLA
uniref:Tail specific protease domain-containing protein n=1 Tax=Entomoneis paludosa TaxID=265537 RepID=A0A7S3DTB8_9STRA